MNKVSRAILCKWSEESDLIEILTYITLQGLYAIYIYMKYVKVQGAVFPPPPISRKDPEKDEIFKFITFKV